MSERLPDEAMTRNAGWSMYLTLFADSKRLVPFALTGYTAMCQFRAIENDQTSTLLATATVAIGSLDNSENFSVSASGNTLMISLTKAQLVAVTADEMFGDVLIKAAGSDPVRVGYFTARIADGESVWPT